MLKLMGKKIFTIIRSKFCLSKPQEDQLKSDYDDDETCKGLDAPS